MKILLFILLLLPFDLFAVTFVSPGTLIALPSAARTATTASDQLQSSSRAVKCGHIITNVSSYTAGSLTVAIQGYNEATATYYDMLTSAAITSTGTTVLKVCPGITSIVNGAANDFLPDKWRINITHGDATSITYSVSLELQQ